VLLSVSLYGTVSRFVWLESAFALGLCFFSLSRGRMLALMFAGIILLPPIGIEVYPTLEQRFTDPGSAKSDALRLQQSEALTQDTDDHLLMGHGFGSYTYKMIRDFKAPYNYEVQWLEILYQMGLIGLLFTLGLLAFNAAPLLLSRSVEAIPVLLLFAFSLLSGFANPSLFGRTAAVGFALVYCFGQMIYDRAHMLACDDPPSDIAVGNPIPI
jgi:O-antigen ligase